MSRPSSFGNQHLICVLEAVPTCLLVKHRFTEGSTSRLKRAEWLCIGCKAICLKEGRAAVTYHLLTRIRRRGKGLYASSLYGGLAEDPSRQAHKSQVLRRRMNSLAGLSIFAALLRFQHNFSLLFVHHPHICIHFTHCTTYERFIHSWCTRADCVHTTSLSFYLLLQLVTRTKRNKNKVNETKGIRLLSLGEPLLLRCHRDDNLHDGFGRRAGKRPRGGW